MWWNGRSPIPPNFTRFHQTLLYRINFGINNEYLVSQGDKSGVQWKELAHGGISMGYFLGIQVH
jgi:hypothetical protein